MLSHEVRWVDLVLENYVVKRKLENLLMERARSEGFDVTTEHFQVQVCVMEIQEWLVLIGLVVFGRQLLRKGPRTLA